MANPVTSAGTASGADGILAGMQTENLKNLASQAAFSEEQTKTQTAVSNASSTAKIGGDIGEKVNSKG